MKETEIVKYQKVIKNQNDELEINHFAKRKKINFEKLKINLPSCPKCKLNIRIELDCDYYCEGYDFKINKPKHLVE